MLTNTTRFVITSLSAGIPKQTANGPALFAVLVLNDLHGSTIAVNKWFNTPDRNEADLLDYQSEWLKRVEPLVGKTVIDAEVTYQASVYMDKDGCPQAGNRVTLIGFSTTGETVDVAPVAAGRHEF